MTVLIQDAYTGVDDTSLDAHTPDVSPGGVSWTETFGDWKINGGKAKMVAASNNSKAVIDSGQADGLTLSCKANSATGGSTVTGRDVGLVMRLSDTDNCWLASINALADDYRIIERVGGADTIRANVAVTINAGTEYTLVVTLNGTTITATIDGANQISYASASSNQTQTKHGIKSRETTDSVDDFLCETTAAGGTAIKKSVNEVLQLNEAIARALALRRFGADTIQLAESIKRAMALSRGAADTVNVAETASKATALRRLVADTVNVVEASRAARGLRRLVAETVTVGITEIITNGGFETAGAGGDDVWINWIEDKQDGAIADETTLTHGGGHAAKLTQGASLATDIQTPNLTVVANTAYTFQFWTRGDGTNAGRYGVYDATHSAEIVTSTTTGIAGTTYALFTTTFTTPAGCTSVRFYLKPAATNGAVAYFDDVSCINHAASWAALGLRRSAADIIGLAETTGSGIATSIVKAINEALQLAETSLRTLALSRPVAETVQILESVIRPARWLRLVAETVTIAETTKAARALRRFASDLVQIVEATGRTLTQPGVITAIVKNIAETLQLIEARSIAKWPAGRLGIDIRRGYAIIRAVGRLYAAVVQGRQYRARHEK